MPKKPMSERPEARLLRVAKRRIAWRGVQGAEIRKLAELAGTSTSRFHEFYRKRDDLLVRVFEDGWEQIQISVARRLAQKPPLDIEEFVTSVVEGAFDAFQANPDDVGATIVLGLTTIGQPIRKRLTETSGFSWYVSIARTLEQEFEVRLPADHVKVALEVLFGALARTMLLMTPMYTKRQKPSYPDRQLFVEMMKRMTRSLFQGHDQSPPQRASELIGRPITTHDLDELDSDPGSSDEAIREGIRDGML